MKNLTPKIDGGGHALGIPRAAHRRIGIILRRRAAGFPQLEAKTLAGKLRNHPLGIGKSPRAPRPLVCVRNFLPTRLQTDHVPGDVAAAKLVGNPHRSRLRLVVPADVVQAHRPPRGKLGPTRQLRVAVQQRPKRRAADNIEINLPTVHRHGVASRLAAARLGLRKVERVFPGVVRVEGISSGAHEERHGRLLVAESPRP